jgi:23S rRNA (adenine2503-C2)-methyltransferase
MTSPPHPSPEALQEPGREKRDARSLSRAELEALVASLGERSFRTRQIFRWLHQRWAPSFESMTDLSKGLRERLAEQLALAPLEADQVQRSSDGTVKFRFKTADGRAIESVYMPEESRRTLCISTQVGCAMGCAFCRTATMGLSRHLTAGEIVDQAHRVNDALAAEGVPGPRPLTNLVFMGMGEPLHNYENLKRALELLQDEDGPNFSHRHLTVSTSGLVPVMERLGRETEVKLAVSLNATTDAVRDLLMPVNRKYPLEALLDACRRFPTRQGRRVTFEYVLLKGVNDSLEDAARLARLLSGMQVKVNLIPYNENPGLPFESAPAERVAAFHAALLDRHIAVITRKNRGRDIAAACGQLAAPEPPAGDEGAGVYSVCSPSKVTTCESS